VDFTYRHLLNNNGYSQTNVGIAYASSTTLTDVSPGAATAGLAFTFPAAYFEVGQHFVVTAWGIVSNTSTPNLTLGVYLGGTAGTALCTTGAIATASSLSNNIWKLSADIWVVSVGTSGSMYALGSVAGPYASTAFMPATSSSGNLVSSLNLSGSLILTVGALWGANSSSNTLQVIRYTIERSNEGSS
jgi:hypothetical protein